MSRRTLDTKKGPEWHGCEACHGPGKAHVDGGGDKTKIFTFKNASAQEISARCLGCHTYGEEHRSEEHTSELQSHHDLVCRLLLEKKKKQKKTTLYHHTQ